MSDHDVPRGQGIPTNRFGVIIHAGTEQVEVVARNYTWEPIRVRFTLNDEVLTDRLVMHLRRSAIKLAPENHGHIKVVFYKDDPTNPEDTWEFHHG